MRSMVREEKRKRSMENSNPFALKKPNSNGPLECGGLAHISVNLSDKRLGKELERLEWNDDFKKAVLTIKRRIIGSEGAVTSAQSGQIDGVNLNRDSADLKVSMYINRWNMILHVSSVSDKKRCEVIDEIKKVVEKNLPEMGITIKNGNFEKLTKKTRRYEILLAGALNKPDELCEGKKNVCKVECPPDIYIPSTGPHEPRTSIRGC